MTKLTIELVPESSWYSNVRSEVDKGTWDIIRKRVYREANYLCEVCGGRGPKWPVECHEVWDYNDETKVQTLTSMIALCPACHEVKHMGLASIRGRSEFALEHLKRVNGWGKSQTLDYVKKAFEVWSERSNSLWTVDISYLREFGVSIKLLGKRAKDAPV